MYRITALILVVLLLAVGQSFSQNDTAAGSQYKELQQVVEKLKTEVENIPYSIQKVANQEISYDSSRITAKGFKLIEHEIERAFTEQGRVNMLQLEEFEQQNVLQITGTDSTLLLKNTSEKPNAKENSLRLLELSQKYGVDAFLKGYVQYRYDVGYVVSLELISPSTREVIWSKSVVSKDLEPEEETYKGKLTLLTVGATNIPTGTYLINQNAYNSDIILLDYNVRLAFRQPVNNKNSAYIGVQGGITIITRCLSVKN